MKTLFGNINNTINEVTIPGLDRLIYLKAKSLVSNEINNLKPTIIDDTERKNPSESAGTEKVNNNKRTNKTNKAAATSESNDAAEDENPSEPAGAEKDNKTDSLYSSLSDEDKMKVDWFKSCVFFKKDINLIDTALKLHSIFTHESFVNAVNKYLRNAPKLKDGIKMFKQVDIPKKEKENGYDYAFKLMSYDPKFASVYFYIHTAANTFKHVSKLKNAEENKSA